MDSGIWPLRHDLKFTLRPRRVLHTRLIKKPGHASLIRWMSFTLPEVLGLVRGPWRWRPIDRPMQIYCTQCPLSIHLHLLLPRMRPVWPRSGQRTQTKVLSRRMGGTCMFAASTAMALPTDVLQSCEVILRFSILVMFVTQPSCGLGVGAVRPDIQKGACSFIFRRSVCQADTHSANLCAGHLARAPWRIMA